MLNILSMKKLLIEAFENTIIKENEIVDRKELVLKIKPHKGFHKNTIEKVIKVKILNDPKIEELYNILATKPPEDLVTFIENNKDVDLNTNSQLFDDNSSEEFITPLALAVLISYYEGEMVENVVYLISKGAKKTQSVINFVSDLEDFRLDANTPDFEAWETIREIFNVDELDVDESVENSFLDGKTNIQARKITSKIMNDALTKTFYTDENWQALTEIWNALNKNKIVFTIEKNEYSNDMLRKIWNITIPFTNDKNKHTILYGTIIAAGAGTVEDPLSRYDITINLF